MEDDFTLIGQVRMVLDKIVDDGTFEEGVVADVSFDGDEGCGAIVGTASLDGRKVTIIANDTDAFNERFPVVFAGVIGLEEAYKMARAVYATMEHDADKPIGEKRPMILIVDTPGNAPGKVEEIVGMNKATGAYQLALAEARTIGHPIIAVVIGRAISGAFLCHGLQADHILAFSKEFGTIIHVMPLTSISRITKMDIEDLERLSKGNPVFASGVDFFYRLGGVNEQIKDIDDAKKIICSHIDEVRSAKLNGDVMKLGPKGRGSLGDQRGGRVYRERVFAKMHEEYGSVIDRYIRA